MHGRRSLTLLKFDTCILSLLNVRGDTLFRSAIFAAFIAVLSAILPCSLLLNANVCVCARARTRKRNDEL